MQKMKTHTTLVTSKIKAFEIARGMILFGKRLLRLTTAMVSESHPKEGKDCAQKFFENAFFPLVLLY